MKIKLLYERIAQDLREKILNGEYLVNGRLPTEADLSEEYGVSRITSKRALEELKKEGLIYRVRGSGSFVAEQAIRADSMRTRQNVKLNNTVAIIMPHHVTESSFAQSITGATKELAKMGFYGIVYSSVKSPADEKKIIRKIYEDGIQGIIYYPISDGENYDLLYNLYLEEYPIVVIDKYLEGVPLSSVVSDNYQGGEMAAEYLIRLGHNKIGFVSDMPIESATSIRDRYFGYLKALKKANKLQLEGFVQAGTCDEYHRGYNAEAYKKMVSHFIEQDISAVFAMNDSVAIYMMRAAAEMGIEIPEKLSIIGFDDLKLAKHLPTPLTTIRQNFMDIGKYAAEMIIKKIRAEQLESTQVKLPVQLVERASCKKMK